MVSRRRFLHLGAGAATATAAAGCIGSSHGGDDTVPVTDASEPTDGTTTGENGDESASPLDLSEWNPDWTLSFDDANVLGLDADGSGPLFAAVSDEGGDAAVAAVDPADESVRWRTAMDGEAVAGSHASARGIARGGWGTTLSGDAVYAVAGRADEREWTALHALDRSTGERRWSLRRNRRLSVAGVSDGLLVAAGLEFFPPPGVTPTSHQTPEEPLTTVVYGLDADDGGVRWTRKFEAVSDVGVGSEGVYVAAGDRLVCLHLDGETRFTLGGGAPARRVEVDGDRAFLLTGEDGNATLSGVAPNGDVDWRLSAPVGELLLGEDRLYAGGDAVLAVDADGAVDWRDDGYGRWLLLDPDGDTLYTRSGVAADAATAYDAVGSGDADGGARWTFDPPSDNAWPEAATADSLVATAITADDADDPFYTVYSVTGDGEATKSFGVDTVFDALGLDGAVYVGDGESNLLALTP
ncbi:PQQ-like beta-propeller repeat protein [Halogeometricum sp. S1BR25-6]|uniref:PQQ-like beta-propeller repeat protein n=1 Tax=Halogeometricum salsisoli TaxID=2950536 RepID=A0ABU2GDV4_9EURY|nr:PQQ-binding-like beta-propeller repeat protein [Halogeometricum sp. S1BR25-6]MDS0298977.1 PQQ-like beta-propeller repeat protein [Halogeometricum sp. S1BR25-6]